MLTRSMTKKNALAHKSNCNFLYDEKGMLLSIEGVNEKIFCIPDRKDRPMYYALDQKTGILKFLGYEKFLKTCISLDPLQRPLLVDKCKDREIVRQFTDDVGKIREFLQFYEKKGGIEPCILDFLEQLSLFTKMTFDDLTEILGGGFTVLKGDKGRIFRKFYEKCRQHKFSVTLPTSLKFEGWFNLPSISSKKDLVPMSSHDKYMTNAFRMGAGELVLCDKEGLYKLETPRKNPRFDILVGLSISKGFEGDTCFQFESCRMNDLTNFVRHGLVFFEYKLHQKNVGAFGYSTFKDSSPLIIETCGGNVCGRFFSKKKA